MCICEVFRYFKCKVVGAEMSSFDARRSADLPHEENRIGINRFDENSQQRDMCESPSRSVPRDFPQTSEIHFLSTPMKSRTEAPSSAPIDVRHPIPPPPRPILLADPNYEPKTRGGVGILIAGLCGDRGLATLAGIVANMEKTMWIGPRGEERAADCTG